MRSFLIFMTVVFSLVAMVPNTYAITYDFSELGFEAGKNIAGETIGEGTYTSETGNLYYTIYFGGGLHASLDALADIYIDFSVGVSNLFFTAGDGVGDFDAFNVSLYEFGSGGLLGTFSSPVFGGDNEPEWYTLLTNVSNVGRVVFDPKSSSGGVVLTELGYEVNTAPVPEPSTVLLLGSGLVCLAWYGRKRKKA